MEQQLSTLYLASAIKQFKTYKGLADKSIAQLPGEKYLHWAPEEGSNSIAIIAQHLIGNLHSRWTDFLTTDGEKPWRNRDAEFEVNEWSQSELLQKWEAAWQVLFDTLASLTPDDVLRNILIRGESHTVLEAINRQLTHYAYHVGQIVYLAKAAATGEKFTSLSIPKGKSQAFNQEKFSQKAVV